MPIHYAIDRRNRKFIEKLLIYSSPSINIKSCIDYTIRSIKIHTKNLLIIEKNRWKLNFNEHYVNEINKKIETDTDINFNKIRNIRLITELPIYIYNVLWYIKMDKAIYNQLVMKYLNIENDNLFWKEKRDWLTDIETIINNQYNDDIRNIKILYEKSDGYKNINNKIYNKIKKKITELDDNKLRILILEYKLSDYFISNSKEEIKKKIYKNVRIMKKNHNEYNNCLIKIREIIRKERQYDKSSTYLGLTREKIDIKLSELYSILENDNNRLSRVERQMLNDEIEKYSNLTDDRIYSTLDRSLQNINDQINNIRNEINQEDNLYKKLRKMYLPNRLYQGNIPIVKINYMLETVEIIKMSKIVDIYNIHIVLTLLYIGMIKDNDMDDLKKVEELFNKLTEYIRLEKFYVKDMIYIISISTILIIQTNLLQTLRKLLAVYINKKYYPVQNDDKVDTIINDLLNNSLKITDNWEKSNFTYKFVKYMISTMTKSYDIENLEENTFESFFEDVKRDIVLNGYIAYEDTFIEYLDTYLVPYYKIYYMYSIELQYKLILNYHKFIMNQYNDLYILNLFISEILRRSQE